MRVAVGLIVAVALLASYAEATKCHPVCRWQCDDPTCPAVCHPVCERPKCQMQCEETPCAKCTVHCEKPQCTVRCPEQMCEDEGCPKCETVCSPAVCHTSCVAPDPVCSPLCEETKCDWKCKKPTMCPKPKCELECEQPAGCDADGEGEEEECCPCTGENLEAAVSAADSKLQVSAKSKPSFLETMHSLKFMKNQGKQVCCPCAPPAAAAEAKADS